jgi:spermidine synthase
MPNNIWFSEIFKDNQGLTLKVSEVLLKKQSEYQEILIFKNPHLGTVMALDGALMLSDLDEHMYHHALTSYGMQNVLSNVLDNGTTCENAENGVPLHVHNLNILVVGGGDGGIVRDLFKKYEKHINKVTMVEIDEEVINASRKFFPKVASALNHPKLDLRCEDALKFIETSPEGYFDLILCDSTDPVGFAAGLIEEDFYKKVKRTMKAHGIFCAQSGSPFFQKDELEKAQKNLAKVFSEVHTFYAPMLVYPGVIWSYTAAGEAIVNKKNLDLAEFI